MRVRYTPRAFADREEVYEYLEKRSPQGARHVKLAIVRAIRGLAVYPDSAGLAKMDLCV